VTGNYFVSVLVIAERQLSRMVIIEIQMIAALFEKTTCVYTRRHSFTQLSTLIYVGRPFPRLSKRETIYWIYAHAAGNCPSPTCGPLITSGLALLNFAPFRGANLSPEITSG